MQYGKREFLETLKKSQMCPENVYLAVFKLCLIADATTSSTVRNWKLFWSLIFHHL